MNLQQQRLAYQVTFILALFLATQVVKNGVVSPIMAAVTGVFAVEFLIQFFVAKRIQKEIIGGDGEISNRTRKFGYILLLFVITEKLFGVIAGAMLVKREKNLEIPAFHLFFTGNYFYPAFSALNLFKEYIVETFWLRVGLSFGLYAILNFGIVLAVNKYTFGKKPDKKFMPFAVICLLGIALGNVFSFVLGLIAIGKYRNKNEEVSVEWIDVIQRLFRNYTAVIGMFLVAFFVAVSIGSNLTFDYDLAVSNNFMTRLAEPSLAYPFGCDDYGRCVFTRIIFGASISLIIGMISTIVPIIFGGIVGAMAGYYGGKADITIMRVIDVLNAVPSILLAIAIIAAFGVSTTNLILALSVSSIPAYARTVRAQVLGISNQEFVEAAKACGARMARLFSNILSRIHWRRLLFRRPWELGRRCFQPHPSLIWASVLRHIYRNGEMSSRQVRLFLRPIHT